MGWKKKEHKIRINTYNSSTSLCWWLWRSVIAVPSTCPCVMTRLWFRGLVSLLGVIFVPARRATRNVNIKDFLYINTKIQPSLYFRPDLCPIMIPDQVALADWYVYSRTYVVCARCPCVRITIVFAIRRCAAWASTLVHWSLSSIPERRRRRGRKARGTQPLCNVVLLYTTPLPPQLCCLPRCSVLATGRHHQYTQCPS